jgi:hypothetical protein
MSAAMYVIFIHGRINCVSADNFTSRFILRLETWVLYYAKHKVQELDVGTV